jgi:hypothetical protein
MNEKYGKLNYQFYCKFSSNKSLVSGDDLPSWDKLPDKIKQAWVFAANNLIENIDEQLKKGE